MLRKQPKMHILLVKAGSNFWASADIKCGYFWQLLNVIGGPRRVERLGQFVWIFVASHETFSEF